MSFFAKMKKIRFELNQVYPTLQRKPEMTDTTNVKQNAFNKSSTKIKIPRRFWFLSKLNWTILRENQ